MALRSPTPDSLAAQVTRWLAARVRPGQSLCAAYSGGLDSTVLLDLLARSRESLGFALSALHVHHGLSPHADAWAQACERFAASLAVPLAVVRVRIAPGDPAGIEAAARRARHAAYARAGADCVVLAHHRDDQAETVLLQALRGTGVKGLAAMGEVADLAGTRVLRPLLGFARSDLLAYAGSRGLAWVEDESNAGTRFDRNYLRHAVLPRVAERFPQHCESLARLARHAAAAAELVEALADEDLARVAEGEGIAAARLALLSPARRANLLRRFLARHGLAMPGEARLAEMLRQLLEAAADARVLVHHDGRALVRHRGRILVETPPPVASAWAVAWQGESLLGLGSGRGEVRFAEAVGEGIAKAALAGRAWSFAPRRGGERLRLRTGGPTRTLKNLLQEQAVPVWRRSRLPLLFAGGDLVWVPGVGIAAAYRAGPGEPGLVPRWHIEPGS